MVTAQTTDRWAQARSWAQHARVPLGFLVGVVFLATAQPSPQWMAVGALIGGVGAALRAWATGHLRKDEALAVRGPYRLTRNPLYLGSWLMMMGCLTAAAPWPLALVISALFVAVYWPVMRAEEAHLHKLFPDEYPAYAARTPLFLPTWRNFGAAWRDGFDGRLYLRHREYRAVLGLAGVFLALGALWLWQQ
ncbi:MAG: isoprenylcysteine carboxylmethyltransferase family protein [Chloracidobacterium sp.]|nr:isoprenylcysteine carboxylmethyltransferase family protein [Chloracidobacterium sp.]MDW8216077.1 isoprenylcysteine carboxylmethyltransferase family protein [Acidobacteriota bacterium]